MYAFAACLDDAGAGDRRRPQRAARWFSGSGDGEQFLASDPAALLSFTRRRGLSSRTAIWPRLRVGGRSSCRTPPAKSSPSTDRRCDSPGIRSRRKRAVSSTSCSRRSTISRRRSRTPSPAESTSSEEQDQFRQRRLHRRGSGVDRSVIHMLACGTSLACGLVGKFLYRGAGSDPGGGRLRLRVSATAIRSSATKSWRSASRSRARPPTPCRRWRRPRPGARPAGDLQRRRQPGDADQSEVRLSTPRRPEIGVASTKAFTTQLIALYLLALYLRQGRGLPLETEHLDRAGVHLPTAVDKVLRPGAGNRGARPRATLPRRRLPLSRAAASTTRSPSKGALKLKEISYIHAEGYPAGEMKHGPIALIDEELPVVAIATGERVFEKVRQQPAGGQGARRRGPSRQRPPARRVLGDVADDLIDGAAGRSELLQPVDQRHRAAAAVRLPRRRAPGRRCRPAAQPGQKRHGGMRMLKKPRWL